MKRVKFLSLLGPIIFYSAFSWGDNASGIRARFLNLDRRCLTGFRSLPVCEYQNHSSYQNGEDYGYHPGRNFVQDIAGGTAGIHDKLIKKKYRKTRVYNFFKPSHKEASNYYSKYVKEIKDFSKLNKLTDEEKARLVLCSSSLMLRYEKASSTDAYLGHDPVLIAKRGKGTCRQFTEIAYDLGKAVGLKTTRSHNQRHSFIRFKIEDDHHKGWYAAEPQRTACHLIKQ